jgi:hypothetical protein
MFHRDCLKTFHRGGAGGPARKSCATWLLTLGLVVLPLSAAHPAAAPNKPPALLVSLDGAVTLQGPGTRPGRPAQKGAKLREGERVLTAGNASATLEFFDGSQLILQENTDLSVRRLTKLPDQGKILRFKLALGSLLAKVVRLVSSQSAFEIEAGGVVCGVRGTQFSMDYDPSSQKLDLRVQEGSVYAKAGGTRRVVNAGEELLFLKGRPSAGKNTPEPGNASHGKEKALPAFEDPVFVDLHNQFAGGILIYHADALNDPDAGGLQHKLNPPPPPPVGAGPPPSAPNPNAPGHGIMEATP